MKSYNFKNVRHAVAWFVAATIFGSFAPSAFAHGAGGGGGHGGGMGGMGGMGGAGRFGGGYSVGGHAVGGYLGTGHAGGFVGGVSHPAGAYAGTTHRSGIFSYGGHLGYTPTYHAGLSYGGYGHLAYPGHAYYGYYHYPVVYTHVSSWGWGYSPFWYGSYYPPYSSTYYSYNSYPPGHAYVSAAGPNIAAQGCRDTTGAAAGIPNGSDILVSTASAQELPTQEPPEALP